MKDTFTKRGPNVLLFIGVKEPHDPVSVATIRRWVVETINAAGVDVSTFTAHSTRAASTSMAAKTATLKEICRAAGWSNSGTFGKYYNKDARTENFGDEVLKNCYTNSK